MKKNNRPGAGRIFRSGLYSTAILAAAVVLAVLVNLAVRAIPARYTEFDLSEGGLYTLGETSRQLAGSLGQDVTIYYLCETGSEDARTPSSPACWTSTRLPAGGSGGSRSTPPSTPPLRRNTGPRRLRPAA